MQCRGRIPASLLARLMIDKLKGRKRDDILIKDAKGIGRLGAWVGDEAAFHRKRGAYSLKGSNARA